ncbi:MAG TPA: MetS family NSS transporter small subunit [Candidatus Microbacterium pullistercoris]|nr:MetS family NSS transporter small subunit [Candidatus Microbacterium pullistercoris]
MTPIAIVFLVISAVVVWGGLIGSIGFLTARPEVESYPDGDDTP